MFLISQRPLVHKTLVSFSLPFIIKAKAQQLINLQITIKVLVLSNTIIIAHIQGYIGLKEPTPGKGESVFPFCQNRSIRRTILETRIPTDTFIKLKV